MMGLIPVVPSMEIQELSAFFEHSPEAGCIATPEGVILRVNESWSRMLGWSNEDLAGHSLLTFLHPEDRASAQLWLETLGHARQENCALHLRHKSGGYRFLRCNASLAPHAPRIYIIPRELPAERAETAPGSETSSEAFGAMAGRVAHDFNNLLTRIHGYSCLLLDLMEENDPNREYMERIQEAGEAAVRITTQLLETSRKYAGELAYSDLIVAPETGAAGAGAKPAGAAAREDESRRAGAFNPSSPTVLVVEDDAEIRDLIRIVLQNEGLNLLLAADGLEALEIGRRYEGKINLLLTDIVMPRMDGMNLAKELQSIRPELPILFISGYAENKLVGEALQPADTIFLPKPFGPQTLLEPVLKLLRMPKADAAIPAAASTNAGAVSSHSGFAAPAAAPCERSVPAPVDPPAAPLPGVAMPAEEFAASPRSGFAPLDKGLLGFNFLREHPKVIYALLFLALLLAGLGWWVEHAPAKVYVPPAAQKTSSAPSWQSRLGRILSIRQTAHGFILTMPSLLFTPNSYQLATLAKTKLARLADVLARYPHLKIQVAGYTDNVGSAAYNLLLSQKRASAVRTYLIAQGMAPRAIRAFGYGEGSPIASNRTGAGRQLNRRVELKIRGVPAAGAKS